MLCFDSNAYLLFFRLVTYAIHLLSCSFILSASTSVQNVSVAYKNSTAVKLTWDYGDGVRDYVMVYCVGKNTCDNTTSSGDSAVIRNLIAGEDYKFAIIAISHDVSSNATMTGNVTLGKTTCN